MPDKEPTIQVPLSEYADLFNLAFMMQHKDRILAAAQARIQQHQQEAPKPKLVEK